MKKEAPPKQPTPPVTNPSKKPTPQPKTRTIEYIQTEKPKKSFLQKIPPEFKPTKAFTFIIVTIFIIVLLMGLIQVPWGSLSKIGDLNQEITLKIKVGLPWSFFVLNLNNPEKLPIKFRYFFIDLIIYAIVAYIINIGINVFVKAVDKTEKKVKSKI